MLATTCHRPRPSHDSHGPHLQFTKYIHANKYKHIKDKHIVYACAPLKMNNTFNFYNNVEFSSMYRVLVLKIGRLYLKVYILHVTHRFSSAYMYVNAYQSINRGIGYSLNLGTPFCVFNLTNY